MQPLKPYDLELSQYCLRLGREEIDLVPRTSGQAYKSLEQDINEFPLPTRMEEEEEFESLECRGIGVKRNTFSLEQFASPPRIKVLRKLRKNYRRKQRFEDEESSASTHLEIEISSEPCNCSKTGCQKMYCECLARGKLCSEICNCVGCKNKQPNELLYRSVQGIKSGKHDSTMMHRNRFRSSRYREGCTCKKSQCLKKYCECYANGRRCGSGCICYDCQNSDGLCDSESSSYEPKILTRSKTRSSMRVQKLPLRDPQIPVSKFEPNDRRIAFKFVLGDMVENTLNCRLLSEHYLSSNQ